MYEQIIVVRIPGKEAAVYCLHFAGAVEPGGTKSFQPSSARLLLGSGLKGPRTRDLSLHRLWAFGRARHPRPVLWSSSASTLRRCRFSRRGASVRLSRRKAPSQGWHGAVASLLVGAGHYLVRRSFRVAVLGAAWLV